MSKKKMENLLAKELKRKFDRSKMAVYMIVLRGDLVGRHGVVKRPSASTHALVLIGFFAYMHKTIWLSK